MVSVLTIKVLSMATVLPVANNIVAHFFKKVGRRDAQKRDDVFRRKLFERRELNLSQAQSAINCVDRWWLDTVYDVSDRQILHP
jgi:hypothetical protein